MEGSEQVVILASADSELRHRLRCSLQKMRWQVREAGGGAAAMALLEECQPEALVLDAWLPDLEAGALAEMVQQIYPAMDLVRLDALPPADVLRSSGKHELLHAIRQGMGDVKNQTSLNPTGDKMLDSRIYQDLCTSSSATGTARSDAIAPTRCTTLLPGMVGDSEAMRELARLVRLVAPHPARVLIEGETGSGKELVARAVHTLSGRELNPFVALNCAAIPETLLEAELFGHTRGAFTGAVQSRIGRIEAANGGTLFLDEIGELPLGLQAKLLRFLENGEIQRIGGNETVRVDVRVVSATHQLLEECAERGTFRPDLYHRLATFPVHVPPLRERMQDLPMLINHILKELWKQSLQKHAGQAVLQRLAEHSWPGNVRELQNVLQRAAILAGTRTELVISDLVFGRMRRN